MTKNKARNVTLICVAGVQTIRALMALAKSCARIQFEKIIFVSPKLKKIRIGKFEVHSPIDSKLDSLEEYNKYILYKLHHHFESSHCLLIQADGYVLDGSMWDKLFLEYDYIGAPWPLLENKYIDPFGNHQRVGNGGFSLRSRKLTQTPNFIKIPWEVNHGEFYKHFNQQSYSEDGNICVHNRHLFEAMGCKFAPLLVASKFSRELPISEFGSRKTFGFHRYR